MLFDLKPQQSHQYIRFCPLTSGLNESQAGSVFSIL